jgi:hypothetical protein
VGERGECSAFPLRRPGFAGLVKHAGEIGDGLLEVAERMVHGGALLVNRHTPLRLLLRRKFFDQAERAGVVLLGFPAGVKPAGVVAGVDEVLDGLAEVPAAFEVHGKWGGDASGLATVMLHQLLPSLTVQDNPALADQLLVEQVLIKHVGKPVPCRQRPVGQFLFAPGLDPAMKLVKPAKPLCQSELVRC